MTDNLLKIREAFVKEGGENCNGVRWVDEAINRIAELEAALKTAVRYLENPEVKAIPFALPVESVVEHIQKLLKG